MNILRLVGVISLAALAACSDDSDAVNSPATDASVGGTDGGFNVQSDAAEQRPDAKPVVDGGVPDASALITLDAMPVPCSVNIRSVSTPDLIDLPAGAGFTVRLRGEIVGEPRPVAPVWQWRVTRMGQDIAATVSTTDPTLLLVPLEQPGRYVVSVTVQNGCNGEASITAQSTDLLQSSVVLRLIPPQNSTIPAQEKYLKVFAGQEKNANLTLADGKIVRITPQRVLAQLNNQTLLVPSAIRISNSESSFLREGRSTAQAAFTTLLGPSRYDVLVVPEDNQLPPLFESRLSFDLLSDRFVNITPGIRISGKILRNGAAVVGARLMLRKDQQPSTIGETDSGGAYALRARMGRHSVRIVGPADTTWPTIEVPASAGIDVPQDGSGDLLLNVNYADAATATLTLTINRPDGSAPAAGALVDLSSQSQNNVATLSLGNAAPINVSGHVALSAVANGLGQVTVPNLPRGIYKLKLRGPMTASGTAAYQTIVNVDLRGGDGAATVNLSSSLTVNGKLSSTAESPANLRVVAINEGDATGAPEATALVAADGTFTLRLSPQATFRLRVDPPLGRLFPRVVFGSFSTETQDKTLVPFDLPKTLRITGRIANTQGAAVPGTIIQAFCTDLTADCIDASNPNVGLALPLSEAVAGTDGQFVLVIPDPGSK